MNEDPHTYYAARGRFTALDDPELPTGGIEEVVSAVQGLLIYDVVAEPFYGVELSSEQADAIHQRGSGELVATIRAIDSRPLAEARAPEHRVGARCHAYSRLSVAMLRAAGVPARARCGFATYFRPGWHEDHWVVEFWHEATSRWRMADAQLDPTWQRMIGFEGDHLAITPSEFVTAGHAWQAWRNGELDAQTCGLSAIDEHGSFWIAHNLRLDLASLNKVEMLPWDVWGAGWEADETPTEDQLDLFDQVAELTVDPDERFADLRSRYDTDEQLRMDGTVFNVTRGRSETV